MTTMDIKQKQQEFKDRIVAIDAEIEKLRQERRDCIIKAKKLQGAIEHVEEILEGKTEENVNVE